MSERGAIARLIARLTGRWHLERLVAIEQKVGTFGRAHRETLKAQSGQLEALSTTLSTRASGDAVRDLERRLERVERLVQHQERTVMSALERNAILDDQGAGDRRFAHRIEELLRHDRPVIVGPWTGEVGFELIYWIPFVRWVVKRYGIPLERLLVVSRGGTASWYGDLASRYADAFDFFSPDEFREATAEARKQRRVGAFDATLVDRIMNSHSLMRPGLLHPGLMYRLFMPFWKGLAPLARVEQYAAYARLQPVAEPALRDLPSEYVAVRFYFSECFPDTAANRDVVRSTLEGISRHAPVVLLNPPFQVDDHRDVDFRNAGRVIAIANQMAPSRNLAIQTAVIARAKAFVGTYGGYSYLAPLCGVSSLALYSESTFKPSHLNVAQHIFRTVGGGSLVPVDVASLPAVRLMTAASLVEAS